MPPPTVLPFPIPDSILLLIHLHLLQCPLQLDPDMFNPNIHGIGDRLKTTEHVIHFLMVEAEGRQRVKVLLPMYPSKKPVDTVAFRNAVVKYLEGLRAAALKPPAKQPVANPKPPGRSVRTPDAPVPLHGKGDTTKKPFLPPKRPMPSARSVSTTVSSRIVSTPTSISSKQTSTSRSVSVGISKPTITASQDAKLSTALKSTMNSPSRPAHGWWWKDIPVRKSLLEECTGVRFERLLLALSIHVLILRDARRNSNDPSRKDALVGLDSASNLEMFNMLCEQPDDHRDLVQRLNLLQLRLSETERNLSTQRHTIKSIKALIPSNLSSERPSVEGLQARVLDLISTLDPPWNLRTGPDKSQGEQDDDTAVTENDSSMLRWLFALAGASRQLEDGEVISPVGDEASHMEGKGTRKSASANRKTILPAPPLPTVAAHYTSHLDALGIAKRKISNLRSIHNLSQVDEALAGDAAAASGVGKSRHQAQTSIVYDSLLGQETLLSDSLKHFVEEMTELEDRLVRETGMKQKLLLEAYAEELAANTGSLDGHDKGQWLADLPRPSEEFNLNFEMESTARLPPVLSQSGQLRHRLNIAMAIQTAIKSALEEFGATLATEGKDGWVSLEDGRNSDSVDVSESDDEDTVNRTMVTHTSPAKSTRIPSFTQTPKRGISLLQPKSTVKRPNFEQSNNLDPFYGTQKKIGGPPTPPKDKQSLLSTVSFSQTPFRRSRQGTQVTPVRVMATPSFFYSPGDGMEDLKDILPPFQSPWRSASRSQRSPRKSGRLSVGKPRVSIHRPRPSKGHLASSSSFVRTPLKSGKRLSSIVPPVSFPFVKIGQATPRASLDDVYEELVDDLVKSTNLKTPPSTMKAWRLLDSKNNIQRSSPFKSLTGSGRAPQSPRSPDIASQIVEEEEESQEVELSFSTAAPVSPRRVDDDDWEDILDGADGTSTVQRPMAKINTKALSTPKFSEGPSFTLRDMLLKVGRDGMLGANGTFNFDLLHESEVDVGNDSMFDGI